MQQEAARKVRRQTKKLTDAICASERSSSGSECMASKNVFISVGPAGHSSGLNLPSKRTHSQQAGKESILRAN